MLSGSGTHCFRCQLKRFRTGLITSGFVHTDDVGKRFLKSRVLHHLLRNFGISIGEDGQETTTESAERFFDLGKRDKS